MRVTLLSRASDLARLQALQVARALEARWPELDVILRTRTASGDRDTTTPLASLVDKGAFTADLSGALAEGDADAVVHSWKDLPLEGRPDTAIVATLERADPRDVLLVRRDVLAERPRVLRVLSSSPRRSWLLSQALPALLPWPIDGTRFVPVRGNITTRIAKLTGRASTPDLAAVPDAATFARDAPPAPGATPAGAGADTEPPHALVVAKAALDRLLGFGPPFEEAARAVRGLLASCTWMVLPLREVPGAPAQGALAIEAARGSPILDRLQAISHLPTWNAVQKERDVLASYGGGCHEAIGATVLPREFGTVVSVRGRSSAGTVEHGWLLTEAGPLPPPAAPGAIWPRPDERHRGRRRALAASAPGDGGGFWVARAEALPDNWRVGTDRLVWAAGLTTWKRLAARGIWVHGCADGLGDAESPALEALAGRPVSWHRLTHATAAAGDPSAIATYVVDDPLPDDLPARTHFFWTSGTLFQAALQRWPELRHRWHGSGPGRTWRTITETLGSSGRARVWLDYEDWRAEVTRSVP